MYNEKETIDLNYLIAPAFRSVHNSLDSYTHFWLSGGRGSTKSSFVSIEIILGIMKNPDANAVVLRKVGTYLRDSVFAQLEWAAEKLGVSDMWEFKPSVPEMIFTKTGQKIIFRGADKPQKLKSTKVTRGYISYIWYEEADEFGGMREIRMINQSLMRGGEKYTVFYSFNPPPYRHSWINKETLFRREDTLIHKSTYLDVPRDWLGEQFFLEAEYLKKVHYDRYRHEYLGEVTGTGGEIFDNLDIRPITDEEISMFDNIKCGIDFGYAADPFVFIACYLHNNKLYIFDEIWAKGMTNVRAAEEILRKGFAGKIITCDSAEPKSINDLRSYGLRVRGARKGPDSIEYGMRFLQGLEKIVIDAKRCQNTAREFSQYELRRDKDGEFISAYPDKNNHSIDAARYAVEENVTNKKARIIKRSVLDV